MDHTSSNTRAKVALLWRGDPTQIEKPTPANNRMYPLFKAFEELNVAAEPVVYADEVADEIRDRLLDCDGVLVWVDPITASRDRSTLDPMLRDVAARGVWVSAHPDVIQKIGTKEVLFRTRHFGWGGDTHLYATAAEFRKEFPARLRSGEPRVLKQRRGNGGIGTWRVEMASSTDADPIVRVQEARRGSPKEGLRLSNFIRRCEEHFAEYGCLIDQAFQPRTDEGMTRCYLVHNEVIGFSTQMPAAPGDFVMAREKTMYDASEPRFATLRTKMESEWVPALQQLFSIDAESLPAIWDADFLYGPKNDQGRESFVLGEINVSAVFPFPPSAVERIAQAALARISAARKSRAARASQR
jgi:uncharacterized protein DUF6815